MSQDHNELVDDLEKFMKFNKNPKDINDFIVSKLKDDKNYWDYMSKTGMLTEEFILNNLNRLNLSIFIQNDDFPIKLLTNLNFRNKITELGLWDNLYETQSLDHVSLSYYVNTIKKGDIKWELINNHKIDEELIRKYPDKFDWSKISSSQYLTIPFIIQNADKLVFSQLPLNNYLTTVIDDEFIRLFSHTDIWKNIGWCPNVTINYIKNHINKLGYNEIQSLFEYRELEQDDLEFFIQNFLMDNMLNFNSEQISSLWNLIGKNQRLSFQQIMKYSYKLDINDVVMYQELNQEILEFYGEKVDLKVLSKNDNNDSDLLQYIVNNVDKFSNELCWEDINTYSEIPLKTINKIKNGELVIEEV